MRVSYQITLDVSAEITDDPGDRDTPPVSEVTVLSITDEYSTEFYAPDMEPYLEELARKIGR